LKRRVYVRYDDGAKAVKYYNAETRKVLTSWNFRHISPPTNPLPPEPIIITPEQVMGEFGGDTLPMGVTGSNGSEPKKRKRNEDPEGSDELQKTCEIHTNYQYLHHPFPDEEDGEETLSIEEVYAIIAGDELTNLKDAKTSPKWPQWQKAIQEELDLLMEMGTWKLVNKPPDAIPIANKWVFIWKWNKQGEVVRYRARLVMKGYAQCPGYDDVKTFSPVTSGKSEKNLNWLKHYLAYLMLVKYSKPKFMRGHSLKWLKITLKTLNMELDKLNLQLIT
jgi:hypothetical protein